MVPSTQFKIITSMFFDMGRFSCFLILFFLFNSYHFLSSPCHLCSRPISSMLFLCKSFHFFPALCRSFVSHITSIHCLFYANQFQPILLPASSFSSSPFLFLSKLICSVPILFISALNVSTPLNSYLISFFAYPVPSPLLSSLSYLLSFNPFHFYSILVFSLHLLIESVLLPPIPCLA